MINFLHCPLVISWLAISFVTIIESHFDNIRHSGALYPLFNFIDMSHCPCDNDEYDIYELKHFLSNDGELHDIFFANIRSIRKNFGDLLEILETIDHKFTFIMLNEFWLGPNERDLFKIDGYQAFSTDRNRHGGGIVVYYKEQYHASIINAFSFISDNFESLFINVKLNSVNFTLGSIYRPPSTTRGINDFLSEFKQRILNHLPTTNNIIIGDFNIDLLGPLSNIVTNFVTEMSSKGLLNLITNPTRVQYDSLGTITSSTIIDHIWNSTPYMESSFVLNYKLTDHYPIGCRLNIPSNGDMKQKKCRETNYNNLSVYQAEFSEFANNFIIQGVVEDVFIDVIDFTRDHINKFFPISIKNVKAKKLERPWIDHSIRKLISKKHSIHRKCKAGLLPWSKFRNYRNILNKTILLSKKMYYKYKFLSMNNNPKNTWKIINSVCNPIKSKKSIILKENNTTIDNGCTIANKLNKSFDAPATNSYLTDDATQYISMHNHSFACFPITPQEVFNVLMNMKNNSILFEFPIKLLKFLKEPLCILLSNIFNYALTQMKFPDILKTGIITPILKKVVLTI